MTPEAEKPEKKDVKKEAEEILKKIEKRKEPKAPAKQQKAESKPSKKEKQIAAAPAAKEKGAMDPFGTLRFVLMTEKAVQMIEAQNKLVFIVNRRSDKEEIKRAIEQAFQSSVKRVNTMIDESGRKKAFVKFREPGQAGEIAIRLGII